MAFKRSAVRSRLSPPRDLEREFRVLFFFAARPRFQRFHDSTLGNGLHEIAQGAFRGIVGIRGNRDFVAFVGIVVCVETVMSLESLETWLRQAGPNRYRVRVSAAARFALLSASRFPSPSQSADAPCDTVAAPCFCCVGSSRLQKADRFPFWLPLAKFAAQVAACLQIWTAAPTPSRLLLPQAAP